MSNNLRPRAGDLIAKVLPRHEDGEINWHESARTVVDGEWPHLKGAARRSQIHNWRGYFKRWVGKPVAYITVENANRIARYWPDLVPAELSRPELTEVERAIRKAERLERQAQELRDGI